MKRLIFSILCLSFPAAFVFGQTPPSIQAEFTVERELGICFARKPVLQRFNLEWQRMFSRPPIMTATVERMRRFFEMKPDI